MTAERESGADGAVAGAPENGGAGAAPGPLLAVCGLCGGAGASMLAFLVARHCARDAESPVLVCDTGGPTAGLATYAGVESPRSLTGVARAVGAGESLADGLFADDGDGLRVLAARPEPEPESEALAPGSVLADAHEAQREALTRMLRDAREAHALTVADCGTLGRSADRRVLTAATHVAWVLPATGSGVLRGRRVLDAIERDPGRRELIVARRDVSERRAGSADLKALASERGAPLVLVPHLPELIEADAGEALEEAGVALAAIEGALWR